MSLLEKALGKMRGPDSDAGNDRPPKNAASGDAGQKSNKSGEATDTCYLSEIDIDIRLDSDLTDYVERSQGARFGGDDLDFDVTNPSEVGRSFVETQVLSINPTRSFSRQLDVDMSKLAAGGFITLDQVNSLLSSTFRLLKRPLLNNVRGLGATVLDDANLIMLTSSLPGEGKTFSAVNLAISIAMERDNRVLLIDGDVNSPSHHEIFGAEMKEGLTDVLMGHVDDISKAIYRTNIPSLSLMFAGSRTPHATELFSSKAMLELVRELSTRYDDRVIIFDSPPLLVTTEAAVLASHLGQVILVIEAEKTRHATVQQSLELLSNDIVLLLLNKMREKNDLGSYGYYGKPAN